MQDDEETMEHARLLPSYENIVPPNLRNLMPRRILSTCAVQTFNEEEKLRKQFSRYFKKHRVNILVMGSASISQLKIGYLNEVGHQLKEVLPEHFFHGLLVWYPKLLTA